MNESETTEETEGGIPLETLGDVRRAMAKDIKRMRAKKLDVKLGNALMFAYTQLGALYQDRRDTLFQKHVKVLWEAHKRGSGTTEAEAEAEVQ